MGQSYKCSVCDSELDSAADIGEQHQFCEECLEKKQEEISKYSYSGNKLKNSVLRDIKEKRRTKW